MPAAPHPGRRAGGSWLGSVLVGLAVLVAAPPAEARPAAAPQLLLQPLRQASPALPSAAALTLRVPAPVRPPPLRWLIWAGAPEALRRRLAGVPVGSPLAASSLYAPLALAGQVGALAGSRADLALYRGRVAARGSRRLAVGRLEVWQPVGPLRLGAELALRELEATPGDGARPLPGLAPPAVPQAAWLFGAEARAALPVGARLRPWLMPGATPAPELQVRYEGKQIGAAAGPAPVAERRLLLAVTFAGVSRATLRLELTASSRSRRGRPAAEPWQPQLYAAANLGGSTRLTLPL